MFRLLFLPNSHLIVHGIGGFFCYNQLVEQLGDGGSSSLIGRLLFGPCLNRLLAAFFGYLTSVLHRMSIQLLLKAARLDLLELL